MTYLQPSDILTLAFLAFVLLTFCAWHLRLGIQLFGWRYAVGWYAKALGVLSVGVLATSLAYYAALTLFRQ